MSDDKPALGVYRAIAAISAALGKDGISKDKTASQGGTFRYRGVDQVYAALNPLLAQHNLVILPRYSNRTVTERTSRSGGALFYTTLDAEFDFICTEDGSRHTIRTIGEAMDSGDKGTNKCMAVAFKYAAFIAFCIPIEGEDDDPDATVHDVASSKAKEQPKSPGKTSRAKPGLTKEEAEREFHRAEALMDLTITLPEVEDIWNNKLNWSLIPESWDPHMKKLRAETEARIKKPAPTTETVPPKFDPAAAEPGHSDDDIPF